MDKRASNHKDKVAVERKGFGERSDCAVVATANVCGISYEEAHAALKRFGRQDRKGTNFEGTTKPAIESLGFKVERVRVTEMMAHLPGRLANRRYLTSNLIEKFPNVTKDGNYLFRTKGHILAGVKGTNCDNLDKSSRRIRSAWKVTKI